MNAEQLGELFGCAMLCLCPLAVLIAIGVARGRRGGTGGGGTGGGGTGGGGPAPTFPAMGGPAPQTRHCGMCGGTGTVPCTCGNGYEYVDGQPRNHHLCGGSGRLRCNSCGGSGTSSS
ncbi:hypothetical protein ACQP1P_19070 [Dactylosporangium sp. CA-052675]|uniref:hypothetical protein n=1 Tax=Dactylosporangium sp. CA-052675 TaxID=3239927 RepID=UPI003D936F40